MVGLVGMKGMMGLGCSRNLERGGVAHGFRNYSRAIEISGVSWGEKKGCVFRVKRKVDTHIWYFYSIKPSYRNALLFCLSQYTVNKWLRTIASGPILTSHGL